MRYCKHRQSEVEKRTSSTARWVISIQGGKNTEEQWSVTVNVNLKMRDVEQIRRRGQTRTVNFPSEVSSTEA